MKRLARLVPVGVDGGERVVAPEVRVHVGRACSVQRVLRVAQHHARRAVDASSRTGCSPGAS